VKLGILSHSYSSGNAFLINTKHSLALLYNDQSVLENHHVALAFQLTMATPAINIFAAMPRDEYGAMRQAIVDMVLATDMSRHFEYLARFQQTLSNNTQVRFAKTILGPNLKSSSFADFTIRALKNIFTTRMTILGENFFGA
jgi:hypothetical protein